MFNRRGKQVVAVWLLLVSAFVVAIAGRTVPAQTQAEKETFPARVLLIRHAEKPPKDSGSVHLNADGEKRAEALAGLFEKTDKRPTPFPTPDFIFATKDSKNSHRPVETVTPLAKKLKLTINSEYANADFDKLAQEVFHTPKYAGKTILICWHHGTTPKFAQALKATNVPETWADLVFDRVWEITYAGNGKTTFRDRPQQLMSGDTEK